MWRGPEDFVDPVRDGDGQSFVLHSDDSVSGSAAKVRRRGGEGCEASSRFGPRLACASVMSADSAPGETESRDMNGVSAPVSGVLGAHHAARVAELILIGGLGALACVRGVRRRGAVERCIQGIGRNGRSRNGRLGKRWLRIRTARAAFATRRVGRLRAATAWCRGARPATTPIRSMATAATRTAPFRLRTRAPAPHERTKCRAARSPERASSRSWSMGSRRAEQPSSSRLSEPQCATSTFSPLGWWMSARSSSNHLCEMSNGLPPLMRGNSMARRRPPWSSS